IRSCSIIRFHSLSTTVDPAACAINSRSRLRLIRNLRRVRRNRSRRWSGRAAHRRLRRATGRRRGPDCRAGARPARVAAFAQQQSARSPPRSGRNRRRQQPAQSPLRHRRLPDSPPQLTESSDRNRRPLGKSGASAATAAATETVVELLRHHQVGADRRWPRIVAVAVIVDILRQGVQRRRHPGPDDLAGTDGEGRPAALQFRIVGPGVGAAVHLVVRIVAIVVRRRCSDGSRASGGGGLFDVERQSPAGTGTARMRWICCCCCCSEPGPSAIEAAVEAAAAAAAVEAAADEAERWPRSTISSGVGADHVTISDGHRPERVGQHDGLQQQQDDAVKRKAAWERRPLVTLTRNDPRRCLHSPLGSNSVVVPSTPTHNFSLNHLVWGGWRWRQREKKAIFFKNEGRCCEKIGDWRPCRQKRGMGRWLKKNAMALARLVTRQASQACLRASNSAERRSCWPGFVDTALPPPPSSEPPPLPPALLPTMRTGPPSFRSRNSRSTAKNAVPSSDTSRDECKLNTNRRQVTADHGIPPSTTLMSSGAASKVYSAFLSIRPARQMSRLLSRPRKCSSSRQKRPSDGTARTNRESQAMASCLESKNKNLNQNQKKNQNQNKNLNQNQKKSKSKRAQEMQVFVASIDRLADCALSVSRQSPVVNSESMADEENQEPTVEEEAAAPPAQQEEEAEAAPPPPPPPPAEKPKQLHQGASFAEDESGRNEAQIRMEEEKKKRMAKMEEEMKEYEEMRKEEREKLAQEISELRSKREQRKQERAEEEKRLAELRAVEEQKRRAEEEERQRRKREEEAKRKEEREKKKKEAEERMKSQSQRNFTISKKSGGEADAKKQAGASGADEAKQGKSKEQLEAEKKAALEQRVQPLNIDGFSESQLQEKAKELFSKIYSLEGDKYDLEQRFKGQNMEMVELTERARQMQKGGQKGSSSKVQTAPDPLSEKLGSIPPKIVMYSQYERVKDHRGFGERQDLFKGPIYGIEYERIKPSSKVILTESGPRAVEITENGDEPAPAAVEAADPPSAFDFVLLLLLRQTRSHCRVPGAPPGQAESALRLSQADAAVVRTNWLGLLLLLLLRRRRRRQRQRKLLMRLLDKQLFERRLLAPAARLSLSVGQAELAGLQAEPQLLTGQPLGLIAGPQLTSLAEEPLVPPVSAATAAAAAAAAEVAIVVIEAVAAGSVTRIERRKSKKQITWHLAKIRTPTWPSRPVRPYDNPGEVSRAGSWAPTISWSLCDLGIIDIPPATADAAAGAAADATGDIPAVGVGVADGDRVAEASTLPAPLLPPLPPPPPPPLREPRQNRCRKPLPPRRFDVSDVDAAGRRFLSFGLAASPAEAAPAAADAESPADALRLPMLSAEEQVGSWFDDGLGDGRPELLNGAPRLLQDRTRCSSEPASSLGSRPQPRLRPSSASRSRRRCLPPLPPPPMVKADQSSRPNAQMSAAEVATEADAAPPSFTVNRSVRSIRQFSSVWEEVQDALPVQVGQPGRRLMRQAHQDLPIVQEAVALPQQKLSQVAAVDVLNHQGVAALAGQVQAQKAEHLRLCAVGALGAQLDVVHWQPQESFNVCGAGVSRQQLPETAAGSVPVNHLSDASEFLVPKHVALAVVIAPNPRISSRRTHTKDRASLRLKLRTRKLPSGIGPSTAVASSGAIS
uniref:Troponin T, skeletal muscle n=1 Tax=Macrostomum lignano TaxID=282301 RepID=A0A1I8IF94_9PLAT